MARAGIGRPVVAWVLACALASGGCAARWAYRQGQAEAKKGNWDLAVARLTRAIEKDPDNIGYRLALASARIEASRYHHDQAGKALAADDLDKAAEELQIASQYDVSNKAAADQLLEVKAKIAAREAEKQRLSGFGALKERAQAARYPVPVLAPRSPVPITLNFPDQSLQKVFEALGKLTGVNILFDEGYRDKRVDVKLSGVSFQDALDQVCLTNRLFYKVLDPNTLIIVPESPTKRRAYEDQLVQTFYLDSADAAETLTAVKSLVGVQKAVANASLGAITMLGTPDQLLVAAKIIDMLDKDLGEVVVEVQILEVMRGRVKQYGIDLSNYEASVAFSPTGASGELAGGFTNVRAHLLSSLNLADFVVNIPSTLFARFLATEDTVKILASPRLRAAEGKKTSLRIGTEVPVPVTTFTATQAGTSTFAPATSFQYKNVGVSLDLTPKVMASGDITLELSFEFSQIGADRNVGTGQNPITVPTFLTRNVTGTLRVRDGETSLLGGLFEQREAATLRGALGLDKVPILNRLLTGQNRQYDDTEILISLTPHLVRAPQVTAQNLASVYAGTGEGIRVPEARPLFGASDEDLEAGAEQGAASPEPPATAPSVEPERLRVPRPGARSTQPREPAPPAAAPAPTESPEALTPESPESPGAADEGAPDDMDAAEGPEGPEGETPVPATLVRMSPGVVELATGATTTVSVLLMGAENLTGVEVAVAIDPDRLQILAADAGPLLTLDGSAVGAERQVEPGRARVRFTRASPTSGSGVVVSFQVRGRQAGPSVLMVESVRLETGAGEVRPPLPGPVRVVVE